MDRSSSGVLAAILLIALFTGTSHKPGEALYSSQARSVQPPAQSDVESSGSPRSATSERNGEEYQNDRLLEGLKSASGVSDTNAAGAKLRFRFMIATAPHPTSTHLALTFDRTVEVIQQALQDSGYYFVRAVLPWDEREFPAASDFKMRLDEDQFNDAKGSVPGALIFRDSRVDTQYLVVLIVAEKPTEGVDRAQLLRALKIASADSSQLLILGPLFSGSLSSMANTLNSPSNITSLFNKIVVASGTVTNTRAIQSFTEAVAGHRTKLLFQTFQFSDDYSMSALQQYARDTWGYRPEELAVVAEDQTVYGGGVAPAGKENTPVGLSFPRNISHLRTAYEQQQKADAATTEDRRITRSMLKAFLGDSRENADTVSTYGNQTPISQESILLGVVEELQNHHTRLLVVAATDPLDMLFLVRYFRIRYPAAHIVTFGADALLAHEADDPLMHGVMSLSTYSISPWNQPPVIAHPRVFPSSDTEATYNAVYGLAGCLATPSSGICAVRGDAIDGSGLFQYDGSQFSYDSLQRISPENLEIQQKRQGYIVGRPALKLDALGNDGFYPLTVLSPDPHVAKYPPFAEIRDSQPSDWHTSRSFNAIVVLLCGVFVILLSMLRKASIMSTWDAVVSLAPEPQDKGREQFTVAVCGMVYLLLVTTLWVLASIGMVERRYEDTALAVCLALVGGGACFALLRKNYTASAGNLFAAVAGAWLIIGVIISLVHGEAWPTLLYRASRIGSGLSPLAPVLLLTCSMIWWCWYNLAGATLVDTRRPRLPDVENGQKQRATLSDDLIGISESRQKRLLAALKPSFHQFLSIGIGIASALAIMRITIGTLRPVATLEPAAFDYVMVGLLALSLGLMLSECTRIVLVWSEAKKLLHALDSQPFRARFNRVRGFSWSSLWRVGTGIHEAHQLTARQFEALRRAESSLSTHKTSELWQGNAEELRRTYIGMMKINLALPLTNASASPSPAVAVSATGAAVQTASEPVVMTADHLLEVYANLQRDLADVAAVFLDHQSSTILFEPAVQEAGATVDKPGEKAADFICLLYIKFVLMVLLRIRTLAVSAAGMFVLIVLAVTAYPLEPRGIIRSVFVLLFLGLITVVALVYAQMHRNATLSRITDTKPGALGGDFWVRLMSLVGLPLITLLAYQFPSIGNFVFSWIEPVIKSLR